MPDYRILRLSCIVVMAWSIASCSNKPGRETGSADPEQFVVVLGNIQDAGYPHIGCRQTCCTNAREEGISGKVTSLGLFDRKSGTKWLFEATPDIGDQLHKINGYGKGSGEVPDGIFITHAHIGHYSGLMYLGREALGASGVPVFVMARMDTFLRNNGPWNQLVNLNNIQLKHLTAGETVQLPNNLAVEPVLVPHRDEYSETVGFLIRSDKRQLFFLPDIDKWNRWGQDLMTFVDQCDYLLIDGTFYQNGEIENRDMSEIPHPFITETMNHLDSLSAEDKKKIYFIHFNHTNPVLDPESDVQKAIRGRGFNIAEEGMLLSLD